jgi:hypothetical protein
MFESVLEHFHNLRHIKRCHSCVSGLNALFRGIEVAMHPFYYGWPKMMFRSVSEHFANLRHIKRCKTWVSGLNALFQDNKVVKHLFYYIRTKMMFGSLSELLANLRHIKRCNSCVRAWMHYFEVSKLWCIHSTLVDPKWCLRVFETISLTFRHKKMKNSSFGPECTISG